VHGSFFSEVDSVAPSVILQVQDITERRQAQAGLHHIAFTTASPGCPTGAASRTTSGQALQRMQPTPSAISA
jgi:hypothetical protein